MSAMTGPSGTRAVFDPATGTYRDGRVTRGFPLGGMGSGGFSLQTDGSFGEFRWNNNWMCPIRGVRGTFLALWTADDGVVVLRGAEDGEYAGVRNARGAVFDGRPPRCTLRWDDAAWPVRVALEAFTPLVPHDVRASTMPAALFRVTLENPVAARLEAAVAFSVENLLGRGGTGQLGVELGREQEIRRVRPRVVWESVAGNCQEAVVVGGRRGVRFRTDQRWPATSHRAGTVGQYLLLCETAPGIEITVCDGWDAGAAAASVLADFGHSGRLVSRASGRRGEDGGFRPAAAVAARAVLAPRARAEVVFALAWWTPDHVTEPALGGIDRPSERVGHVYETHFRDVDEVATTLLVDRDRLARRSTEVGALLADSTLPPWLVRAIESSVDSVLANTVLPASGRLYTLEGLDWGWFMGGLTGTNDQRLASHPYTATFFPDLDLTELDEFRRLADARGAVPHGNGNCDLGLGTTDVPYGWPLVIKGFLPAKEWTDLAMSLVLQVARHWRTTGRRDVLDRFWPACERAAEYLHALAPHGVPEGGTTYDVWDFRGTFAYSATLYLATLAALADLARRAAPARVSVYEVRRAAAAARLDALWDARGFWQTADGHPTLFTATLAGDWAARWVGLDPVVPRERAASHLRHAHRTLVRAGRLPEAEADFDGAPVVHHLTAGLPDGEVMTYVSQVLAFLGMEAVYVGLVDEGLETLRSVWDRVWADGHAWSAGLRGNGESIYMTHPVAWAALAALTGAALDVPGKTLRLGPRTGGDVARLRCPVFFPGVWAVVEHDAARAETSVEVVRTFGVPVTIERLVLDPPDGAVRTVPVAPTVLAPGTRLVAG
jgi:uncharacterized protein (DUF608 family)